DPLHRRDGIARQLAVKEQAACKCYSGKDQPRNKSTQQSRSSCIGQLIGKYLGPSNVALKLQACSRLY
ncbi:MAG: hypothetical protein QW733_05030, partial [Desulfurococcaceae archaeon]